MCLCTVGGLKLLRFRAGRTTRFKRCLCTSALCAFALVGPSGLEPPTSCLSGTRSNLLSYDPIWLVVVFSLGFSRLCLFQHHQDSVSVVTDWWRWWDSNPWPPACRAGALPAELHPHWKWLVVISPSSFYMEVSLVSFLFKESNFSEPRADFSALFSVLALSYLPVPLPAKYFRHCRA